MYQALKMYYYGRKETFIGRFTAEVRRYFEII